MQAESLTNLQLMVIYDTFLVFSKKIKKSQIDSVLIFKK